MRTLAAIGAVVLPLALTGCGDQDADPPTAQSDQPAAQSDPPTAGAWQTERLGDRVAADTSPLMVVDADDVLVLTATRHNVVRSYRSVDGGAFEAGEPVELPLDVYELDAARLGDGSWYAVVSGHSSWDQDDKPWAYRPVALRSSDGLAWDLVALDGFSDDAEVHDIAVVDDRIVMAGGYRTEQDPSHGGFEAHTWTSDDGEQVTQVDLPGVPDYHGYADEAGAYDLLVLGDDLLLGGRRPDDAALWRSTDGGGSWETFGSGLSGVHALYELVAVGDTVLASGPQDGATAMVSHDRGATWARVKASAAHPESGASAPVWSAPGLLFTLVGVDRADWSKPEVCYADLSVCGSNPGPQTAVSGDGEEWNVVQLPSADDVDEIAGTEDGRILVLTDGGRGPIVHSWPAGPDLPVAPPETSPPTTDINELGEGEKPEVGVRYNVPLYTHCGIQHIWFAEETWRRTDDGPGYETGAGDEAPEGWPVPPNGGGVYGFATLGADGVLKYTTEDGTVLATYVEARRPHYCM